MGLQDGHRIRLRERFLTCGQDALNDFNLLELLLFYAIPRKNTNDTAHELIERFGTLNRVFEATVEELCQVNGITENGAVLIKLMLPIASRYAIRKAEHEFNNIIPDSVTAGEFLKPYFAGERDEVVYMISMDSKCKILETLRLFRGSVNSASISIRKIVGNALKNNATRVILAHNHTSGIALPSNADIETTARIKEALAAVDVILVDHLVMSDNDFVSMADSGNL